MIPSGRRISLRLPQAAGPANAARRETGEAAVFGPPKTHAGMRRRRRRYTLRKVSSPPFSVDAFALYESRLTPEGAVYSAIERYPLG